MKSNLLLIPCFLVAAVAISLLTDNHSFTVIVSSATDGTISDSFLSWLRFFIVFNYSNWIMVLCGIAAYIVLISDLAFIHSLIDKHVRFGSKSFRSIASGFNINVVNSLIAALFAIPAMLVTAVIMAAIMKTCVLIPFDYSYLLGVILCAALLIFMLFLFSLFLLWLPCVEVTGFKKYEALNYSYALTRSRIGGIFLSAAIPAIFAVVITVGIMFIENAFATYIAIPLIMAALFIYECVLSYIVYVDAEGIEREDLKKY
jgi:hypothetical protein